MYLFKERRLYFFTLFSRSGSSLIFPIELLVAPYEVHLGEATFSKVLPPRASTPSSSLVPSELLLNGRFADSDSLCGCLTAITSSETELEALSFCLAGKKRIEAENFSEEK